MTAVFLIVILLAVVGLAYLLNEKTRPVPKAECVILRGEDYDPEADDNLCCGGGECDPSDPQGIRAQAAAEIRRCLNEKVFFPEEGDVTAGPSKPRKTRKARKATPKRRRSNRRKSK